MDIERLTKSQIVLLTLLVSFVTSIATGIVTVSLMDQAPPAIAQTVNRVIEHTIERVATSTSKGQVAATVVTQEKTVVVKEADLISQALARVNPSIVRLYSSTSDGSLFLGLGIVLDGNGMILTDEAALGDRAAATVVQTDGPAVRALVVKRDDINGFAYLSAATSTSDGTKVIWNPVTVSATKPALGETIVMLSGKSVPRIADGLITALIPDSPTIDTNVDNNLILPGSPLIDTNGALVGVSTWASRTSTPSGFVSGIVLIQPTDPKSDGKQQ